LRNLVTLLTKKFYPIFFSFLSYPGSSRPSSQEPDESSPILTFCILPCCLYFETRNMIMRSPCCLCVCKSPRLLTFETFYVHHGTRGHLNGVRIPPNSLYVYPFYRCYAEARCISSFIVRQRLSKHVPSATNIRKRRNVLRVFVSLSPCRCWITTFPRQ
jgi:hypothetical protein